MEEATKKTEDSNEDSWKLSVEEVLSSVCELNGD